MPRRPRRAGCARSARAVAAGRRPGGGGLGHGAPRALARLRGRRERAVARRGRRVRDHCLSSHHPPGPCAARRTRREARGDRRAAAPDGGARPPRRRVEQGRGDDGAVRGRGRRRARRHLHRRRARRRAQPAATPPVEGGLDGHAAVPAARDGRRGRGARRPAALAGLRRLRACPRATRCRRCRRAASRSSRSRRPAAPLVELVREFRPHVITTYDPTGGYPHPDHIMCHRVSVEAFDAAGDPERYRGPGRAVDAAQAVLQPRLLARADARGARGARRRRPRVAVRRVDRLARGPRDPRARGDHADRVPRVLRRSGTRRCGRTPRRSTRTASSSRCRATSRSRSGRPRSTSSPQSRVPTTLPGGRPVRRAARTARRVIGAARVRRRRAEPVAVGRRRSTATRGGLAGVPRVRRDVRARARGGRPVPLADQAAARSSTGAPSSWARRRRRGDGRAARRPRAGRRRSPAGRGRRGRPDAEVDADGPASTRTDERRRAGRGPMSDRRAAAAARRCA